MTDTGFNFDPTKASAAIEVLSKGDYEFSIGEPKAFEKMTRKNTLSQGVRWPVTVEEVLDGDPNAKGKRIFYSGYVHSIEALGFTKQIILASLGYKISPDSEKEFNKTYAGLDWQLDFKTGAVGDAWREPTGKRAICTLDVKLSDEDGTPQQQFKKWRSLQEFAAIAERSSR